MTIEESIEDAWLKLGRTPMRVFVTPSGRVGFLPTAGAVEVGTYTRDVMLGALREDVYWAFDRASRAMGGSRRC